MAGLGLLETSIFYNRVGEKSAVMGHSMGGGAAFIAAENDSEIDALLTLASAETNPSAIAAAAGISIPALIIAGGNDCVTPPVSNQLPMYENLQGECKTYINIIGGSHCQMANSNFFCGIGEATCSPQPEITREQQHQTITGYITNWLKAQLNADCAAGTLFDSEIIADAAISFIKTCLQCQPLSIAENKAYDVTLSPNPFTDGFQLTYNRDNAIKQIVIYDVYSRRITDKAFTDLVTINSTSWNSGIFLYVITDIDNNVIARGKLIKK